MFILLLFYLQSTSSLIDEDDVSLDPPTCFSHESDMEEDNTNEVLTSSSPNSVVLCEVIYTII